MYTLAISSLSLLALGRAGDVGFEGLYESSTETVSPERCFDMPRLPGSLKGNYLIGGPGVFDFHGEHFQGLMDGFGKMNRLRFDGSRVCLAVAMLNSAYYNDSVKLGHVAPNLIFEETVPPRHCPIYDPVCDLLGPGDNNWVNSFRISSDPGKVLLLSDTTLMLNYDLNTMSVTGVHSFNDELLDEGSVGKLGSAHPHADGKGGFYEITTEQGKENKMVIYHVSKDEPDQRKLVARYEAQGAPYLHSFGLTDNFAVIPHNIHFSMWEIMKTKGQTMGKALKPGYEGVRVVNLKASASGQSEVTFFKPEAFFHVHVINTYENSSGVVMDVGASPDSPFVGTVVELDEIKNKSMRDSLPTRMTTRRYHFHMSGASKGTVTEEVLSMPKRTTEFGKINDNFAGKPYCFYYATEWFHDEIAYGSMALLRHNVCTGERKYWARDNWFPSEAIFIPRGEAETDGLLMFVALNGKEQKSYCIVLDAATMEVVDEAPLEIRIPFTGHGEFFDDRTHGTAEPFIALV